MENNNITVTQFNTYIKRVVDSETFLKRISITGELSQFSIVRGITYFVIKDSNSILNCVMFESKPFLDLKIGDKVIVKGNADYYVKGGKLNFKVFNIEKQGQGDIYKEFLELKAKLKKEGLFDEAHKKEIPKFPKRIGVITSRTGSVIKDIINVTNRRNKTVDIFLNHASVQGKYASREIIKSLEFFENYDVDVVVIARGGGSMEDLQAFNNEGLARKIYAFPKPIISAVGHETDFSISDFVADLRAPTPSAAAELIVSNYEDELEKLIMTAKKIIYIQNNKIYSERVVLASKFEKLNMLISSIINNKKDKLENLKNTLKILDPKRLISKGYARIEKGGKLIKLAEEVNVDDTIDIYFKDGKLTSKVKSKEEID